jgi:uncharacterized RDD family membrane protein YckC
MKKIRIVHIDQYKVSLLVGILTAIVSISDVADIVYTYLKSQGDVSHFSVNGFISISNVGIWVIFVFPLLNTILSIVFSLIAMWFINLMLRKSGGIRISISEDNQSI